MRLLLPFLVLAFAWSACNKPIELPHQTHQLPLDDMEGLHLYAPPNGGDTLYVSSGKRYQRGALWRSTDGGTTWDILFERQFDYQYLTQYQQRLFLIASNDLLWYSDDGGSAWATTQMGKWDFWFRAAFNNQGQLLVVGGKNFGLGYVQRFDAQQQFWSIDSSQHEWRDVRFLDDTTAVVAGYGGVHKSTNAGQTWTPLDIRGDFFLRLHFFDTVSGYVMGRYGSLWKTDDGGATWKRLRSGSTLHRRLLNDMLWLDADRGYLAGDGGLLLYTDNAGKNWTPVLCPGDQDWTAMALNRQGKLLVLSRTGLLLRQD